MYKTSENFSVQKYHEILSVEFPDFLYKYISLPIMQRLNGVGLLCGTDWTPLFNNQFYYSRLDHSIGVALIIWNFTHDKKQTLAGLFHDVSSPAFSHVSDFRCGDALTQESTEKLNGRMVSEDQMLIDMLKGEGFYAYEVRDYHKFPIADNAMPGLSADRLEYMYPSGASLDARWSLSEIQENYSQIAVLTNERGEKELGFMNESAALKYMKKFIDISMLLQHNEDKVAMQLMADVLTRAIYCGFLDEKDLYTFSEQDIIKLFQEQAYANIDEEFNKLFFTFRKMRKVEHTEHPLDDSYCVSLDVKKRYVDPLVCGVNGSKAIRVSRICREAKNYIDEFLNYNDTKYGCVPWIRA